jgi:hypothetical protein
MKKLNFAFAIGVGWIAFWMGAVALMVGEPGRITEPCKWYDVIYIGLAFLAPFLLGWEANKFNSKK